MKISDMGIEMFETKVQTFDGGFIADRADAPDLALIFDAWAMQAAQEAGQALDDDQLGRAARLRGKAEGLRLAAAELRRHPSGDIAAAVQNELVRLERGAR